MHLQHLAFRDPKSAPMRRAPTRSVTAWQNKPGSWHLGHSRIIAAPSSVVGMTIPQPAPTHLHIDDAEVVEVAPGITRRSLTETEFGSAWLIDFAPRTEWPEVDHHPTEERYFVLEGELIEGEVSHRAGTYVTFAAGSYHQPRTEIGARILGINEAERTR